MNLKEDIFKALDGKGYDDFTKIRWIYLYVCEKFSYDVRFYFGNQTMKENIYNVDLNITNVEEFEIVCYTISRILVEILTEFGYEAEVIRENNTIFSHAYVIVRHNGYELKLDPTKRHDITRTKMNATTLDFENLKKDDFFSDQLLEADKNIAPDFNGLYFSEKSVIRMTEMFLKEIEDEASKNKLSKTEIFLKKMEALMEMVNSRTDFKRYDDIDFYYSYLLRAFQMNKKEIFVNGKKTLVDHYYIRPVVLFNRNDKNMKDIINISLVEYESLPPIFYLLKKDGENFTLREIFRDEAIEILRQYVSPTFQFMLENAAVKLATDKQNGIVL